MARLIVRNSSLVYPPVPDAVYRDGDVVLPLVDRFEETLFMAGPGYDALRARFPQFNLYVRARAQEIGRYLPDWLGERMPAFGHSVWETYADHFSQFSLGPLLANDYIAREVAASDVEAVVGWELEATEGWWAGRQMVAEVAQAVAGWRGVPAELTAPDLKRALRDTLLPGWRCARALRHFRAIGAPDRPAPDAGADVLFVVPGPTIIHMLERIAEMLQSAHGLRVAAVDTPFGGPREAIGPGRLPRQSLYAFVERWMARSGAAEAVHASGQFAATAEALREWPVLNHLPLPLQEVLLRRLHGTMVAELPVSLLHARLWHAALEALRPRVLVSFNTTNEVLAPAVLQARHRGIPTVCLQHGIWGTAVHGRGLLPHDLMILFGEYARRLLAPLAAPHTRFVLTGHSMYDNVQRESDGSALRAALLGDHEHIVVVTTQPAEERLMAAEERWWVLGLAEACRDINALMLIKPHPHETELLPKYRRLADTMPDTVRVVGHGEFPLDRIIAASDVLATRYSTTAFDAAVLQKPVMTVNLSGGPDQYPFAAEGAALGVSEYEEIMPVLDRLLNDRQTRADMVERQQRFLDRHIGPRDHRATERIAAEISGLLD